MHYEVEQKFRLADPAALEARLAALGASLSAPVLQVDWYFAHPARDFATTDEALRIRTAGALNYVTYKGPKIDAATKTRRELELPIESGETGATQFAELLVALGFRPVAAVRKLRRKSIVAWREREFEVVLDDVAQVGAFAEIELPSTEAELDAARAAVRDLAAQLGLTDSERRSYLEMLLAAQAASPGTAEAG